MTISGQSLSAVLIDPATHTGKWAEAWQIIERCQAPTAQRAYLVRIQIGEVSGVGFAVLDDVLAAEVEAAGLPAELAVSARMLAVLPAAVDEARAKWLMRFLARKAVRDLPIPPWTAADAATWRSAIDVLADVAVKGGLTPDRL